VSALVADEVFHIAREAIRNASRHADAKRIDVEIDYDHRGIALRIGDDGVGIGEDILTMGEKPGHWGLTGMRERATRIGGAVTIRRRPRAGTELSLSIPSTAAYAGRDLHG
jgi:signal transduction histidine kinase